MTEQELLAELAEYFKKEDVPSNELPEKFQEMVDLAHKMGVESIFPVVILDEENWKIGEINFNRFNQTAIILYRFSDNGKERTDERLLRTLAHEIGHCDHLNKGLNPDNFGFVNCEDYADEWRERILKVF